MPSFRSHPLPIPSLRVAALALLLLLAIPLSAIDLSLLIDPQSTTHLEKLKITPNAPYLLQFPATFGDYNLELSASTPRTAFHGTLSNHAWGLTWIGEGGKPVARLTVRQGNDLTTSITDRPFMQVTLERLAAPVAAPTGIDCAEGDSPRSTLQSTLPADTLLVRECSTGANHNGGSNLLTVTSTPQGLQIWFGADGGEYVGELPAIDTPPLPPFTSMQLWSTRPQTITDLTLTTLPDLRQPLLTTWTPATIHAHLSDSTDSIEGLYTFFDRDTDTRFATPGGTYTLALLRSTAGGIDCAEGKSPRSAPSPSPVALSSPSSPSISAVDSTLIPPALPVYDLIYLQGAVVNRAQWTPGMLKGRLYATPFPDTYQLEWFDAYLIGTLREQTAAFAPSLLTLRLPLNHATLRFRRLPLPK